MPNYCATYDAARKDHPAALLAKINKTALEAAASKARTHLPSRIPSLARDVNLAAQVDAVLSQCGGSMLDLSLEETTSPRKRTSSSRNADTGLVPH